MLGGLRHSLASLRSGATRRLSAVARRRFVWLRLGKPALQPIPEFTQNEAPSPISRYWQLA
jgi:ketosteroid isomerase-like protein